MSKKNNKRTHFTLIEIAVAMSIFAILMLILMQIFSGTQRVWRASSAKASSAESARMTLDMISKALENAIYSPSGTSFYCNNTSSSTTQTSPSLWIASTSYPTNLASSITEQAFYLVEDPDYASANSKLYQLYLSITTKDDSSAWDFRTSTTAHTSATSDSNRQALRILDNVAGITITPVFHNTAFDAETPSHNYSNYLPHYVIIVLNIVDDDDASKQRYSAATTNEDRATLSSQYTRVVTIKQFAPGGTL